MTISTHEGELLTYAVLEGFDLERRLQVTVRVGQPAKFHMEGKVGRDVTIQNPNAVEAFGWYLVEVIAPTMRGNS